MHVTILQRGKGGDAVDKPPHGVSEGLTGLVNRALPPSEKQRTLLFLFGLQAPAASRSEDNDLSEAVTHCCYHRAMGVQAQ